ncbi:uncharacterized protein F5891DRAFT_915245, partial [Suillus fuscotomentosus]
LDTPTIDTPVKRWIMPDKSTNSLYYSWITLVPTLINPLLRYSTQTHGKTLEIIHPAISVCRTPSCSPKQATLMCLFFDHKLIVM